MKRNLYTIEEGEGEEESECFVELKKIMVIVFYSCFFGLHKGSDYYLAEKKREE